jgi:hypothetical protein
MLILYATVTEHLNLQLQPIQSWQPSQWTRPYARRGESIAAQVLILEAEGAVGCSSSRLLFEVQVRSCAFTPWRWLREFWGLIMDIWKSSDTPARDEGYRLGKLPLWRTLAT